MEEDYSVITNQCGDDFLEVTSSPVTSDNLQSAINFSYQGFKFVESVDSFIAVTAVNMKLKCSVIVCDANDWYSDCAWGCIEHIYNYRYSYNEDGLGLNYGYYWG